MTVPKSSPKTELPLDSDAAIAELVRRFESCTLPHENWTHRAHLAVALYYLREMPVDDALNRMRQRIQTYNRTCGNPNGYNETITRVFLRRIDRELQDRKEHCAIHVDVARLAELCSVDWLYQYYSRELIWSEAAKGEWVEPDVSPLDF